MISHQFIEELWYGESAYSTLLTPVSWLYAVAMLLRRLLYASGIVPVQRVPVPVIVVGNITVGGTGKTPLIIWLAQFLKQQGYRPGIVSRGYGGTVKHWPQQVRPDSNPYLVGDEPVLIAQRTHCPVAISPYRYHAAKALTEHTDCDLILCDDGLQHHALYRDIEIAVVDGGRQFGNGRCLPAGPLREMVRRLKSVDLVVGNGVSGKSQYLMEYLPLPPRSVQDEGRQCDIAAFAGQPVHAVAAIGNPERFFSYLRGQQLNITKHIFPDHHPFKPEDLKFDDGLPVLMTEKDAVKCREFAGPNCWYIPIEAKMASVFEHRFATLLNEVIDG